MNRVVMKILGGENAKESQFPYQASMRVDGNHVGGCSIINDRWFVTAAHCLDGVAMYKITVAVGSNVIDDPNAKVYNPKKTFIHENWSSSSLVNDIGLIQVTESIEMSANVQPIPLNTQEIPDRSEVILSGWTGSSDILQWITLKTLNNQKCQDMDWYPRPTIRETHVCTLIKEGEGACFGDSGGPLVWNGQLCGILSFGNPWARGAPDVFTKVSGYIHWINALIAENSD